MIFRTVCSGRTFLAAALVLAAALSQGCAYSAARWRDFTDVLSLGMSAGGGLGFRAKATHLIELSLDAQKDEKLVGWRERSFRWVESGYGLLFASWRRPTLDGEPYPEKRMLQLLTTSWRRNYFPARTEIEETRHVLFVLANVDGVPLANSLDVSVGISALIAGLEMTVSPGELADFLLGWFTVDIGKDDDVRYGEVRQEFPKPQR